MSISCRKRFRVLKRHRYRCHYCGARAGDVELHIDHVTPRSKGGTDDEENLVPACPHCNGGKSNFPAGDVTSTAAAPTTLNRDPDILVGRFCTRQQDDGTLNNQCRILGKAAPDIYLVQYFSFMTGCPTECHLVKIDEFLGKCPDPKNTPRWFFFETIDDWRTHIENYAQRTYSPEARERKKAAQRFDIKTFRDLAGAEK